MNRLLFVTIVALSACAGCGDGYGPTETIVSKSYWVSSFTSTVILDSGEVLTQDRDYKIPAVWLVAKNANHSPLRITGKRFKHRGLDAFEVVNIEVTK